MDEQTRTPVLFWGARITFRNFSGIERQFNEEGNRNFVVLIDDEKVARTMEADGWNIQWLKPREEGESSQAALRVHMKYRDRHGRRLGFPPRVYMITSHGKTRLTEDTLELLDTADITNVDLSINPRVWNERGEIKAYLKAGYFTIREDELEMKYIDYPDSSASASSTEPDEGIMGD